MTGFEYPPSREFTLQSALNDVKSDLASAEQRVDELEADDDAVDSALREAHQEREDLEGKRNALEWAIDEFGEDASVSMTAFTATTRARALDEMQSTAMGEVGGLESRIWLLAAALDTAPWLDGSEDLAAAAQVTGMLPPAVQDFLDDELTSLNDLGEGNS